MNSNNVLLTSTLEDLAKIIYILEMLKILKTTFLYKEFFVKKID
jgi:hypothetical protein